MKLKIKKLHKDAILPKYAKPGDAAMDLYALFFYPPIQPGEQEIIRTGIAIGLESGYCARILPRSGLGAQGIDVHHGLVDSGYIGEVKVIVRNLSDSAFCINAGDRIAQMLVQQYAHCEIEEVAELSATDRGESGFGSSGK